MLRNLQILRTNSTNRLREGEEGGGQKSEKCCGPTKGPLVSPVPYISHCVIFIILFRIPTDGRESSPQDDSEMGCSVTGPRAATNITIMNTGFKGKKHRQNKNKKQQLSETTSDLIFKLDI